MMYVCITRVPRVESPPVGAGSRREGEVVIDCSSTSRIGRI